MRATDFAPGDTVLAPRDDGEPILRTVEAIRPRKNTVVLMVNDEVEPDGLVRLTAQEATIYRHRERLAEAERLLVIWQTQLHERATDIAQSLRHHAAEIERMAADYWRERDRAYSEGWRDDVATSFADRASRQAIWIAPNLRLDRLSNTAAQINRTQAEIERLRLEIRLLEAGVPLTDAPSETGEEG